MPVIVPKRCAVPGRLVDEERDDKKDGEQCEPFPPVDSGRVGRGCGRRCRASWGSARFLLRAGGTVRHRARYFSRSAFKTASRLFFASPNSMRVFSRKNKGFSTPA